MNWIMWSGGLRLGEDAAENWAGRLVGGLQEAGLITEGV